MKRSNRHLPRALASAPLTCLLALLISPVVATVVAPAHAAQPLGATSLPSQIANGLTLASQPAPTSTLAGQPPSEAAPTAGNCDTSGELIVLNIEGFGRAHFQDFETNTAEGTARLYGGVCIEGAGEAWTIIAEEAAVSGLREGQHFEATIVRPLLRMDEWEVFAQSLDADEQSIRIADVRFSGYGLTGTALRAQIEIDGQRATGWQVSLRGRNLSVDAEVAQLEGQTAHLTELSISTCNCSGAPFYTVDGSAARLDLDDQRLSVDDGHLDLAGLRFRLDQPFELNAQTLDEISLPVTFEYDPNGGTGLGVLVPDLELAEGLSLELGLLGLDRENPLQALALIHYEEEGVDFTVGRARGGPRADFQMREKLGDEAVATFTVRNRHEEDWDYLHEGALEVRAVPFSVDVGGGARLTFGVRGLAAASAQDLPGGVVAAPRLGVGATVGAQVPVGRSSLESSLQTEFTAYPTVASSQYGVTVDSSWRYSRGPWTLRLGHLRRWTDSGSPFTTRLDRLLPTHDLSARAAVTGGVPGGGDGDAQLDFGYDLLRLRQSDPGGLKRLGASFGVHYPFARNWTFAFRGNLELAGVFDPDPGGDRRGYAQVDLSAERDRWEAGARVRYGLREGSQGLSLLEARAAVPLTFSTGVLTPFLALDFAPLVTAGQAPEISGHGMVLTWESCCGTFTVGYRQQNGNFVTELGVAIDN